MSIIAPVILVLLETGTAALAEEGNVAFRMISAEQTGIQAVFKKWNVEELSRQGGKWQSHGWWPWGLTAFDFDGDGDLDLLPTHHGRPHGILLKSLLRESGQLTFVNATKEFGVGSRDLPGADGKPWIWDFDGDGWLDIAGWSDESKPNSLLNLQGKKFVVIPEFSFHPISHAEEVSDLNGDGYLDVRAKRRGILVTGTYDPQSRRFLLKNEGDATPQGVPQELRSLFLEYREDPKNRFLFPTYSFTHDLKSRWEARPRGGGSWSLRRAQTRPVLPWRRPRRIHQPDGGTGAAGEGYSRARL
jgi:hypothetical protein